VSKEIFVRDVQEGQHVTAPFVVLSKSLRERRNQPGAYLALELGDRTGRIEGRVWENAESVGATFQEGDVILVSGKAQTYNQTLQLNLNAVRRLEPDEYTPADFLPTSEKDLNALYEALRSRAQQVTNPHLRALLISFLDDPEFATRFKHCPASRHLHHSFLGGLLEHTESVMRLSDLLADHYPDLDRDLLVSAAILHDVGKVEEYAYEASIEKTAEGILLGHITLGDRLVWAKMNGLPGFPARLKAMVSHIMLSHHGQLEFGSPKRPKTREALVLHAIEDLDAQLDNFRIAVEKARHEGKEFTEWERVFGRQLYAGPEDYE